MRTVDLLTSVRDLLADQSNWTSGNLAIWRRDKFCYCALGGILKEGGAIERAKEFGVDAFYVTAKRDVVIDGLFGLQGLYIGVGEKKKHVLVGDLASLPKSVFSQFAEKGVHALAITNAIKYLKAAIVQVIGVPTPIYAVNDNHGYDVIMTVLNVAIKNAKRRHINGKRTAGQAVAQ